MHEGFRSRLTYANVASTLALFVALGGGAYAAVGGALVGKGGVIHGCARKSGGPLTVVRPGKKCPKGTVSLAFNQKGQTGAVGPAGAPGAQGEQGVQGQQGVQGAPGISNYQIITSAQATSSGSGVNLASQFAFCPAGTKVIGGGFATNSSNNWTIYAPYNGPSGSTAWFAETASSSLTSYTLTTYAICATVTS